MPTRQARVLRLLRDLLRAGLRLRGLDDDRVVAVAAASSPGTSAGARVRRRVLGRRRLGRRGLRVVASGSVGVGRRVGSASASGSGRGVVLGSGVVVASGVGVAPGGAADDGVGVGVPATSSFWLASATIARITPMIASATSPPPRYSGTRQPRASTTSVPAAAPHARHHS